MNDTNEEDLGAQPDFEDRVVFSYHVHVSYTSLTFEEVVAKTRQSLIQEGFDIVMEFAFHDYLRQPLGRDVNRCTILGACHPELVEQLLQGEDSVRPSMLCNIIIQDAEDGESVQVSITDPSESWEAFEQEN